MAQVRVQIQLPEELWRATRLQALKLGVSASSFVNEALVELLQQDNSTTTSNYSEPNGSSTYPVSQNSTKVTGWDDGST